MNDKTEILFDFRETASFSRKVAKLLTDDEYAELQWSLIKRPDAGALIIDSSGLRKVRRSAKG